MLKNSNTWNGLCAQNTKISIKTVQTWIRLSRWTVSLSRRLQRDCDIKVPNKFEIVFFSSAAIVVLFVALRRQKKEPLIVFEEEDIRENIITYDDEGGGEEDTEAFDIATLQVRKTSTSQSFSSSHPSRQLFFLSTVGFFCLINKNRISLNLGLGLGFHFQQLYSSFYGPFWLFSLFLSLPRTQMVPTVSCQERTSNQNFSIPSGQALGVLQPTALMLMTSSRLESPRRTVTRLHLRMTPFRSMDMKAEDHWPDHWVHLNLSQPSLTWIMTICKVGGRGLGSWRICTGPKTAALTMLTMARTPNGGLPQWTPPDFWFIDSKRIC